MPFALRRPSVPAGDPAEVYRQIALHDFALDVRLGLFVAYYRNFAIPSIAAVLRGTGEMEARPLKRSYDTGIVIYEIIANGFEHPRSQEMLALLRRVHKGVPGTMADYRYVLLTQLVCPLRWIEQHGWRKPLPHERDAMFWFYMELGARMGLKGLPGTLEDAFAEFDAYEDEFMGPSEAGAAQMAATAPVLADMFPNALRGHTAAIVSAMMGEDRVRQALGLEPPSLTVRGLFAAALAAHRLKCRLSPVPDEPSFRPGRSGSKVYPSGYRLSEVGPDTVRPPDVAHVQRRVSLVTELTEK